MECKLAISPKGLVVIERDIKVSEYWNVHPVATEIMQPVSDVIWHRKSMIARRYPSSEMPDIDKLFDMAMFNIGMIGLERMAYELSIEHRQRLTPDGFKPVGFYTHYTEGLECLDPVSSWHQAYALIVFDNVAPLAAMQEFNGRHNETLSIYIDGIVGHYSDKLRTYLEANANFRRGLIIMNSDVEYLKLLTRTI